MRTSLLLRLAVREIVTHKNFSAAFVLKLSLGLLGFVALVSIKASFQYHVLSQSREGLTGDIAISSRRTITPEELEAVRKALPSQASSYQVLKIYSMIESGGQTRLVEVKGIEPAYPFYGEITLRHSGILKNTASQSIHTQPVVWIYPELMTQLNLHLGSTIKVGEREYKVADIIDADPSAGVTQTSLAPTLYMGMHELAQTKLIQFGSTLRQSYIFKVPSESNLEHLVEQINTLLVDPGIRVSDHVRASDRGGRLIKYLMDYLGLVALTGFFLSVLGIGYFFLSYFSQRLKELAILISLGLTPQAVRTIFLFQVGILGAVAAVVAVGASALLLKLLPELMPSFMSFDLSPSLSAFFIAPVVSILGSVLVCLPISQPLSRIKPALLFQEEALVAMSFRPRDVFAYIPALTFFWTLAVWQAHSFVIGSLFIASLLAAGLTCIFVYLAIIFCFKRSVHPRRFFLRLAFLYITRKPLSSSVAFVALCLGAFLTNLIPQVRTSLEQELDRPRGDALPSFFLFDIQPDQIDALATFLRESQTELSSISPMVSARLLAINDVPFTKSAAQQQELTREQEREDDMRNRSLNVSYREKISAAETISTGEPFAGGVYDGSQPAQVSLEFRFAERMGIHIGDLLRFDIQGVEVVSRVVNLRKVRWTSFQPNFFVQFQPGVLDDAPKTYLASLPWRDDQDRDGLQARLVRQFPNVSIVDVKRTVAQVLGLMRQIEIILGAMALLSLFSGLAVSFSICRHQTYLRRWDITLLKVLGARATLLRRSLYVEFAALACCSAILGGILAIGMGWTLSFVLFDRVWGLNWQVPLLLVAILTFFGFTIAHLTSMGIFRTRASITLSAS